MDNIFRAYDIRGKYPDEINEKIVEKITQFLGRYFALKIKNQQLKAVIIIGYDARLSSLRLYRAAIKGIKYSVRLHCNKVVADGLARNAPHNDASRYADIKIIKAGMITTPMLYFLVNEFNADGGIMITASHNPKDYNGLKIVGKKVVPINGKEILKIMNNE